jgi:hypothetical protein
VLVVIRHPVTRWRALFASSGSGVRHSRRRRLINAEHPPCAIPAHITAMYSAKEHDLDYITPANEPRARPNLLHESRLALVVCRDCSSLAQSVGAPQATVCVGSAARWSANPPTPLDVAADDAFAYPHD